jgi:hypothetical protein
MHRTRFVIGITALFLTTGIVVIAQHGPSGAPKPPHTTTPAPKTAPSPHSTPKASKPVMATQPKSVKPVSTPKTTKTEHGSSVKPVKTDKPATAKAPKTDKSAATKVAKAEKNATTTSTVTLTPVQEKLKKNTNLAAKMTSRLPEGTDLMLASAGFRNLGQFVAAVNVSNNLKIPFTELKTKMVTNGSSLGQAIQALRPTASATIESQRAEYDARGMISESELEPQITSTSTTTSTTSVATSSKTKAKVKTKKSAQ